MKPEEPNLYLPLTDASGLKALLALKEMLIQNGWKLMTSEEKHLPKQLELNLTKHQWYVLKDK